VDGGILEIRRRAEPLLPPARRAAYEQFVRTVFTGRGRGLDQILARATRSVPQRSRDALRQAGVGRSALPRDVTAEQWVRLFLLAGR
jgi:23S rRNA (adenine-N6)-dimethyltransferase